MIFRCVLAAEKTGLTVFRQDQTVENVTAANGRVCFVCSQVSMLGFL